MNVVMMNIKKRTRGIYIFYVNRTHAHDIPLKIVSEANLNGTEYCLDGIVIGFVSSN